MAKAFKSDKKRKKKPHVPPAGGLDEDRNSGIGVVRMSLKTVERSRSTPVAPTERVFAPMRVIESRLLTAMKTIRATPDKEKRFQIVKGSSIPYLQEYMDAYASSEVRVPEFVPTPKDHSDCLTALSWVRHVDKKIWKIMWMRSFGLSFGLIGKYTGRSDETVRRWYREGIVEAWSSANGARSLVAA